MRINNAELRKRSRIANFMLRLWRHAFVVHQRTGAHASTKVLSLVISFIVRGVAVSATLRSAASSEDVQSASFEAMLLV